MDFPLPVIGLVGPNAPQLDTPRQQILDTELQQPQIGTSLPQGSTWSAYRVRPNVILPWDDFSGHVTQYCTQFVTQADKVALVARSGEVLGIYENVAADVVYSETTVKVSLDREPIRFHQMITTSTNGQPLPSDIHSQIQRFDPGARMSGWSDYFFRSADGLRVTAMLEGKNPWKVTPTSIDQVLNGTAPLGGDHAGRLAVEQMYGYMYHNQVQLGVISTLFGWVFLRRQDLGHLYITRMLACRTGLGQDYIEPQGFTIMQALYYFSRLAEELPPLQETTGAQPGFVHVDRASTTTAAAAPQIQILQEREFILEDPGRQYLQVPQQPQYILKTGIEAFELIFESWNHDKKLGEKTWLCKLVFPENKNIIIKIWDSFKCNPSARDREVAAYMKLQTLWGKVIPTFIASCPISIFHGIIIEYLNGSKLSAQNWTTSVEWKLRDALDAIHDLGMIHGDIRLENILVDKDENVWFIDFETAFPADSIHSTEAREAIFQLEKEALSGCFQSVQLQED